MCHMNVNSCCGLDDSDAPLAGREGSPSIWLWVSGDHYQLVIPEQEMILMRPPPWQATYTVQHDNLKGPPSRGGRILFIFFFLRKKPYMSTNLSNTSRQIQVTPVCDKGRVVFPASFRWVPRVGCLCESA